MKKLILLVVMMFSFVVQPMMAEEKEVDEQYIINFIEENNLSNKININLIKVILTTAQLHYNNRDSVELIGHEDYVTLYFKKYGEKVDIRDHNDIIKAKKAYYDYADGWIDVTWNMDKTLYCTIDKQSDKIILGLRLLSTTLYITVDIKDGKTSVGPNEKRLENWDVGDVTEDYFNGNPEVLSNQYAFNQVMYKLLTEF